jgi:hypothetical protein
MSSFTPLDEQYPNQLLGLSAVTNANAGAINKTEAPLRVNTNAATYGLGAIINSGSGVPVIGGNLNDLWIRTDAVAETAYFYRCTTAGVAGSAVWTAMGGA